MHSVKYEYIHYVGEVWHETESMQVVSQGMVVPCI